MKNTIVLEMINNGEIEQLKALLMEEIYKDSLKGNREAKSRYAAMKRFFKYPLDNREAFTKPCEGVEVHGKQYNSFLDGYCFALTTEGIDTLETFDKTDKTYFDVERIVNSCENGSRSVEEVDFSVVLADGKSKGYKFKKTEIAIGNDFQYLLKYKDAYYKFGLFDRAFSVINDGEKAEVYYTGSKGILLIKTSIGIAGICAMNCKEDVENHKTIIYTDNN